MNPIIKSLVIVGTVFLGLIIAAGALSLPPSASSTPSLLLLIIIGIAAVTKAAAVAWEEVLK